MVDELKERNRLQLRLRALSRWEGEGDAPGHCANDRRAADHMPSDCPLLTNVELVQLRVRAITLENVVVALLSQPAEPRLQRVREMAAYISPRPGFNPHPLTLHAAAQMSSLVERAKNYQATADPEAASEQVATPRPPWKRASKKFAPL